MDLDTFSPHIFCIYRKIVSGTSKTVHHKLFFRNKHLIHIEHLEYNVNLYVCSTLVPSIPFVILWIIFFRWIPFQRVWIEPIPTKQERRVLLQGFPINWVVSKAEVVQRTNLNRGLSIMFLTPNRSSNNNNL